MSRRKPKSFANKDVRITHSFIHSIIHLLAHSQCCLIVPYFIPIYLVGIDASTVDDNNLPSVKQEPVSDDDCPSEEGYGFDGENDPFDEDDTFVHSKFQF